MKKYPFSKQFLTLAAAAAIALPSTAVFADQGDITYELVPVKATTSAIPSIDASIFDESTEAPQEGLLSGSISEVMPTSFATAVTTANPIEFEVKGIGSKTNKNPLVKNVTVEVYDLATRTLVDSGSTLETGKFKTTNTLFTNKSYYAVISDGKVSMTTPVFTGKPFKDGKTDTQKVTFLKYDDEAITTEKSVGAIKGFILGGTEVRIYNNKNSWTVPVNGNGTFNVYLQPGKYNVVVMGATDSGIPRNILYKNVTVAKGQASAPLDDMVANAYYADEAAILASLGLPSSITLKATDKTLKIPQEGLKNTTADSLTFTLKDVTSPDSVIILGTQKAVTGTKAKEVNFKLKTVQAGKNLIITAVDGAFNTWDIALNPTTGFKVPDLKKDEAVADLKGTTTNNTVENAIYVTFKDKEKIVSDNITSISVEDEVGIETILTKSSNAAKVDSKTGKLVQKDGKTEADGDYMISSGKITFGAGKISKKAGKYKIKISGTGFEQLIVEQELTAGVVNAAKSEYVYTSGDNITITARDQYENLVKDAQFYMDIETTTSTSDTIKIDGTGYKASKTNVAVKSKTGADGTVKVTVSDIKADSKVTIKTAKTGDNVKVGVPLTLKP